MKKNIVPVTLLTLMGLAVLSLMLFVPRGGSTTACGEDINSFLYTPTEYATDGYIMDGYPKAGDPHTSLVLEHETNDWVWSTGFYINAFDVGDITERIRITHDGFLIVGKHKITLEAFVGAIEEMARRGTEKE